MKRPIGCYIENFLNITFGIGYQGDGFEGKKGKVVGRIYGTNPMEGERYYLESLIFLLLLHAILIGKK